MGWLDIGGMGKAIWGAVTRPFTPPPPPPPSTMPTLPQDASRIQSGGVGRLREATLIDWRTPPVHGAGDLVHNNTGSLISNNTGSFSKPWWRFW